MKSLHPNDRLALLYLVTGLGSFAGGVLSLAVKLPLWVTIALLGIGAAGHTASQLLRFYGAPTATTNTGE